MNRAVADRFRAAVTFLTSPLVVRARLPERYGRRPIFLSTANRLAVLKPGKGRFDSQLFDIVERFIVERSVAWDIGANMGLFSLPAAHKARAGFVLAIEPDPLNQRLLQRTRAHPANGDIQLEVLPVAVSNKVGTAKLQIARHGHCSNALLGGAHGRLGGVSDHLTVMTVTLDWVMEHFPAPDFIKCDAEGAERWILEGATSVLVSARPVMQIEMPKENAAFCKAIFARHEYATFSAFAPIDPAKELSQIDSVWEVLAVPREKLSALAGK